MTRIGLFGGTFDPVHKGHITIARVAKRKFKLDRIVFIPAGVMPHKAGSGARAKDRLEMVKLAIQQFTEFSVSDYEIKKRTPAYTIETVRYWKKKLPSDARLFFIIGLDAFNEIKSWRKWEELFQLVHFVVINRPGYKKPNLEKHFAPLVSYVVLSGLDISSTGIRKLLQKQMYPSVKKVLDKTVYNYIIEKNLYS